MISSVSAPIVTGLLAYGMSGRLFQAPFIDSHPGFNFRAVTERSKKKVAQRYPGVISYDSTEQLLADPEIELVIVNTPNNTHFELAKQVLQAGKHVLVEKPLSATVAEAKYLYALAAKANRHLLVYQNRRWDSDFLSVKEVIESGKLGKLIELNFRYDRFRPGISAKTFKEDASAAANGIVYDLGPHLLDQVISLLGEPLHFNKTTAIHRENSQVADYFNYHLCYPSGVNVFLTAGWLIAQPSPAYIVHGTLGSFVKERTDVQEEQLNNGLSPLADNYGVELAGSEGTLTLMMPDGNMETQNVAAPKGDYHPIFEAVFQTIMHNAPYPITEEQVLSQIAMLNA